MQLLERIQLWFELNMPDALVRPTEAIRAIDWSLLPLNKYKPVALIELLKEARAETVCDSTRQKGAPDGREELTREVPEA